MNVLWQTPLVIRMLTVLTLMVPTSVLATLGTLEVDSTVVVCSTKCIRICVFASYDIIIISMRVRMKEVNFSSNEVLTTMLRLAMKGGTIKQTSMACTIKATC